MVILVSILFILSTVESRQNSLVTPTHLLVTRVGPCYEYTNAKIKVSEMKLTKQEYDFSLTGSINISMDIDNGWFVKATMQKCHDIRNIDTCDHFKSFSVIKSGCGMRDDAGDKETDEEDEDDGGADGDAVNDDEDIYTMFFHYVTPKMECPIRAGNYQVNDYPFFTEDSDLTAAESKISTSVFGYTYRLEAFGIDDEDRIMCMDAYIQMTFVRDHNWTISN